MDESTRDLLRYLHDQAEGEERLKWNRLLTCITFHEVVSPMRSRGYFRLRHKFSADEEYRQFMRSSLPDRNSMIRSAEDLCLITWGFSFDINVVHDEMARRNFGLLEEFDQRM